MKKIKKIGIILASGGFSPIRLSKLIFSLPIYLRNLFMILIKNKNGWKLNIFPMLADRFEQSGVTGGHYFHIDLWAARLIYKLSFKKVVDVGSRVDGFIAHILVFRDIEIFDVRPLFSNVRGLTFKKIDMAVSSDVPTNYVDCVTCLHTLEHFGLGRYGDIVDIQAWITGLQNMAKMINSNGSLIIAVPVGRERIEFDAHRVFNPYTVINQAALFDLKIISYSYVDDEGNFHENSNVADSLLLDYGCGCFHFIKLDKLKSSS
jgi:hypothetical protein